MENPSSAESLCLTYLMIRGMLCDLAKFKEIMATGMDGWFWKISPFAEF